MPRTALIALALMLALPAVAGATTYTVTTTGDSDGGSLAATCGASPPTTCSLRDAIKYSAAGDTVSVPPATYTLTLGALTVAHDLRIAGASASSTTITANQSSGVFTIGSHLNVTISGLTVTGGHLTGTSVQGAGINTSGNLTLTGDTITQNTAESPSGGSPAGGGIEVAAGNLTMSNSAVTLNEAKSDSGAGTPQGGGIDDSGGGLVSISGSRIDNNSAYAPGGGGGSPKGGGIHDGSSGTLTISGSELVENMAPTVGSGGIAAGGGLQSDGGGVVSIVSTTLTSNAALAQNSVSAAEGGGIASLGGSLAIANSTIGHNAAISGPATGTPSATGGGVLSTGSLALTASTISNNQASASANGTAQGGGLALLSGASIVNSTVFGNGTGSSGTGSSQGGGVFSSTSQPVTFLNATVDGNSAPGGSGASAGGNLFQTASTAPTIENSIMSGGSAASGPNCAGGVTSKGHNLEGGGTDCGFTAAGDRQGVDPIIDQLQDNGGPTQTQGVQPGSPVIDAGDTADCPATDQRGVARPQGSACDIGALEVELPQVAANPASGISQTAATLNGSVSPNTLKTSQATYHFDYGPTTAYTDSTPTTSGSGAVSAAVSGLSPNTTYHYRLVATNSDGGYATSADATFTTRATPAPPPHVKPKITGLGETHRLFVVGRNVTPLNAAADNRTLLNGGNSPGTQPTPGRHAKGTVFSFTLNQAATVKIKLTAQKPGRLQGRKCRPPSPKLQNRPRCTRSVRVVTLTRTGIVGLNLVAFSGRLPHRILAPGRYQAVLTANNANGISGPQTIGFTVVRK